jgi:hypothetical protein
MSDKGFTFTEAVGSFVKKVKNTAGVKASQFFTMKTSFDIAAEKYEENQRKQKEEAQAKNNLDSVVDEALVIQRNQINRMLKCKSLFPSEFLEIAMKHEKRDFHAEKNRHDETELVGGFLSDDGYGVVISVYADWNEKYKMTFVYSNGSNDIKQTIGPLPYDELVCPEWVDELIKDIKSRLEKHP